MAGRDWRSAAGGDAGDALGVDADDDAAVAAEALLEAGGRLPRRVAAHGAVNEDVAGDDAVAFDDGAAFDGDEAVGRPLIEGGDGDAGVASEGTGL